MAEPGGLPSIGLHRVGHKRLSSSSSSKREKTLKSVGVCVCVLYVCVCVCVRVCVYVYIWTSLVAQLVKNPRAMQETLI